MLLPTIFGNINQNSRIYVSLSQLSALSFVLLFVYTIPFGISALVYWKRGPEEIPSPAVDREQHTITVQFSTNWLVRLFGLLVSPVGTLSWINTSKTITLTKRGSGETVFDVPYQEVEKFISNLNYLRIKVKGKTYSFTPYDRRVASATLAGIRLGNQLPALVVGTAEFTAAGVPGLAAELRAQGTNVTYTKVARPIELAIPLSFVLLLIGAIVDSIFIVR